MRERYRKRERWLEGKRGHYKREREGNKIWVSVRVGFFLCVINGQAGT